MLYDQQLAAQKLHRWKEILKERALPSWEQLPVLELYMDQVTSLLTEYLSFLPKEEGADSVVTAAAINNYVRKKIMPPPVKKRYSRVHLAYLIMICSLKQCVSIAYIQQILPLGLTEDQVRALYDRFAERHRRTCLYFSEQISGFAEKLFGGNAAPESGVADLVVTSAVLSGLTRLLAEEFILLHTPGETES